MPDLSRTLLKQSGSLLSLVWLGRWVILCCFLLPVDGAIHDHPDVAAYDRERVLEEVGIRSLRVSDDFTPTASDVTIQEHLLRFLTPRLLPSPAPFLA